MAVSAESCCSCSTGCGSATGVSLESFIAAAGLPSVTLLRLSGAILHAGRRNSTGYISKPPVSLVNQCRTATGAAAIGTAARLAAYHTKSPTENVVAKFAIAWRCPPTVGVGFLVSLQEARIFMIAVGAALHPDSGDPSGTACEGFLENCRQNETTVYRTKPIHLII